VPAILVVVLLLALLLLMSSRRRAKAALALSSVQTFEEPDAPPSVLAGPMIGEASIAPAATVPAPAPFPVAAAPAMPTVTAAAKPLGAAQPAQPLPLTQPVPVTRPYTTMEPALTQRLAAMQPSAAAKPLAAAPPLDATQPFAMTRPLGATQAVGANQSLTMMQPLAVAQPAGAPMLATAVAGAATASAGAAGVGVVGGGLSSPSFAVPVAATLATAPRMVPAATQVAGPISAPIVPPAETPSPLFDLTRVASSKNAKLTVKAQGPVGANAGFDPLNATLMDILNGWGELTAEDTKRLDIFRADRLTFALAAIQAPKTKSGDGKLRLTQLRQYSVDMEHRALAAQINAAAAAQAAVVPVPGTATDMPVPAASAAAPPIVAMHPDEKPLVLAPQAGFAGVAAVPEVAAVPSAPTSNDSAGMAAALAAGAATLTIPHADHHPASDPGIRPGADLAVAAATTSLAQQHSDLDDLTSFWAEPRSLWKPDKDPAVEELPAPTYDEVEVRPETSMEDRQRETALAEVTTPEVAAEAVDAGPAATVAAGAASPFDVPTSTWAEAKADQLAVAGAAMAGPSAAVVAEPLQSAEHYFWDDIPTDPLTRLSIKVETAEQLLALPPQERVDMAAFLGPSELAATFRATDDLELKKAVIDTLEHIGSPTSLNALGNCFEDGDSEIQRYALEAADRLLGVA
jgi:hypothetical protein